MADATITPVLQVTTASGVTPQPQGTPEPGALLSGTIAGKDANGNFLLKTANGNLSLHSNLPLTYNSDVVIRMEGGGAQANTSSAKIVSVNGTPFSEFVQQEQPEEDSISNSLLSQTSQTVATGPSPLAQPNIIHAVVQSVPASANATAQSPAADQEPVFTSGTEVVIRLPAATAEASSGPPPATTPLAQPIPASALPGTTFGQTTTPPAAVETEMQPVAEPLQPSAVSPPASATGPGTPDLPQPPATTPTAQSLQTTLYAAYSRQSSLSIPSAQQTQTAIVPTSTDAPQAKAVSIQGQVVSADKDGTIIVQTQTGAVTLKSAPLAEPASLTSGTSVTIELPENISQTTSSLQTAISSAPAPLAELAASWSTLKDIINVINETGSGAEGTEQTSSSGQTNNLLARLPAMNTGFASSSLSFMSSLANGDAHKILGEDVINLLRQNGRTDLLQKFAGELATVSDGSSAKAGQPTPTWQATVLPFVYSGELQQARIYIKRDAPDKKQRGGSAKGGTRFVVEVSLSEYGGMQMDGLIRKMQSGTIFDLMIRSNTGFSKAGTVGYPLHLCKRRGADGFFRHARFSGDQRLPGKTAGRYAGG